MSPGEKHSPGAMPECRRSEVCEGCTSL